MSAPIRRTIACVALVATAGLAAACSSGSTEAYCYEAASAAADNPAAVFAAWNPADPATTEQLVHATDQLHQLADVAPPEISEDAGLIASTADELSELLREFQGDELETALRDRETRFAEVDQASLRVVDFTRAQCGVDLLAPPTSTSTTAPPVDGASTTTALP